MASRARDGFFDRPDLETRFVGVISNGHACILRLRSVADPHIPARRRTVCPDAGPAGYRPSPRSGPSPDGVS